MRIAYCEDEIAQAELIRSQIMAWSKKSGISCNPDIFPSAESFLFAVDEADRIPYDLILLDISMSGMDGFSLAKLLRKRDDKVRLAFLTSDVSHVFEGYELQAWRYIPKPLDEQKTSEMLDALAEQMQMAEGPSLLLEVSGEHRKLYPEDIVYVEVTGHYTTLHMQTSNLTVKENFKDILERINQVSGRGDTLFVKCHRSAAVNISKVERIGKQSCVLSDGTELPVSRGMYQTLNEHFIKENL